MSSQNIEQLLDKTLKNLVAEIGEIIEAEDENKPKIIPLWTPSDIMTFLQVKRNIFDQLKNEPDFPKEISLSNSNYGSKRWVPSEVIEYINSRRG